MIKILAIDDNKDNLVALNALLNISMPEAIVITATNGKVGVELAELEKPDIILLDIVMPDMDGYEVLRKLKGDSALNHIPIIMLTAAMTDMENKTKALELGADAFLAKPIDESELMAQIKAMLRIKKSEDLLRDEKDYLDKVVNERTRDLERELVKRIEIEEQLRSLLQELENGKRASLNLMDDLQSEINERIKVQAILEKSRTQLRELNIHVENVREKERAEISREIHDVLGQALTAVKFDLSWIRKQLDINDEDVLTKIDEMKNLIDETTLSVQRISTELRPGLLDDLGLRYALEWQCGEFERRTEINCTLKIEPEEINIYEKISVCLFRIVQESLTNVARHAKASKVEVSLLKNEEEIELKIIDNGVGIKEEETNDPKSLGLLGITERAYSINGDVSFSGKQNIGTEVKVIVKLQNEGELK